MVECRLIRELGRVRVCLHLVQVCHIRQRLVEGTAKEPILRSEREIPKAMIQEQ